MVGAMAYMCMELARANDDASERGPAVLLDPTQVSAYPGVPVGTLANWRYQGFGPTFVHIGRHVRYGARTSPAGSTASSGNRAGPAGVGAGSSVGATNKRAEGRPRGRRELSLLHEVVERSFDHWGQRWRTDRGGPRPRTQLGAAHRRGPRRRRPRRPPLRAGGGAPPAGAGSNRGSGRNWHYYFAASGLPTRTARGAGRPRPGCRRLRRRATLGPPPGRHALRVRGSGAGASPGRTDMAGRPLPPTWLVALCHRPVVERPPSKTTPVRLDASAYARAALAGEARRWQQRRRAHETTGRATSSGAPYRESIRWQILFGSQSRGSRPRARRARRRS